MKILLTALIILASLWGLFMGAYLLMLLASSHNVPKSTYVSILANIGISVTIIAASTIAKGRIKH